jgi:tape measure domain-containing protein
MAGRKSSIGAQLTLDKRGFKAALDAAKTDAQVWKAVMENMKISKGALAGEGFAVGRWTELSSKINVIGGGLKMVGGSAAAMGKSMFSAEASFENLVRGLSSTSDGSETLREELEALREVAKMPGLGFREAIQGATALKGAKLSAAEAREALVAFGNALTNAGKGKAELNDVLMSIQSMISTGQVDMENLKEIATRIPGFLELAARVPKGNALEWVRGIIKELKQLPQAAESAQDKVDNFKDALDQKRIGMTGGKTAGIIGALTGEAMKLLQGEGLSLESLTEAATGEDMIAKYQPSEEELARRKKLRDELAAAEAEQKRLAEQKVKDDEEAAKKAKLAASKPQRDEAMASLEVLRLRAAGKNKKADELQQKQAETARAKQLEEAGMPAWLATSMAEQETSLNKTIASGRRKTYKGEADTGFKGLELLDAMRNRMDLKPLSEEWSFTGLDDYKRLQSNNRPKKEASAAAGSRANATAGDPVTKALNDWGPKMVQELTAVNQKLEAINSKPVDRL